MSIARAKRLWWNLHDWRKPERVQLRRRKRRRRVGAFVFRTLGRLLNRVDSMFVLSYRPDFDYDLGGFPDYDTFYDYWTRGNESNNGGDVGRLYCLYLNTQRILDEGVKGDFVELGVYKGNSAKILCEMSRRGDRQVFLFDTFGGFDERELREESQRVHNTFADTTLASVKKFVGEDAAIYVQGRFPESFAQIAPPACISLVHLDCDLYAPMKAGLEEFYPLMSAGGIFVIHDYSSGWWPGARKAVDEFLSDKPERLVLMPDKSGTAIFRKQ
jgi:hypothetical protein